MGEGLSASQGLGEGSWRALVRALEHYRMSSPVESLGPPAHPLAQGWVIPKPSNRMLNLPLLTFQLMTTKPPFLISRPQYSLLDSKWGARPTVVLINSWAGQRMVTHWQLAACEWSHLRHQTRLSYTCCPGTGWVEMKHINGLLHRAVLTLLCYIVNRLRITMRLRFVKVVLKVGWLWHSYWFWHIS